MTTTFAEYSASAEARKDVELAVLGHTYALCEALRQNYINYCIRSHQHNINKNGISDAEECYHLACIEELKKGICDYEFYPETGRKYHKVIMNANGARSVAFFVDKKTGSVYKAASWRGPAKGERCNLLIIKEREWALEYADWAGSWLYRN
jgi:hypothetical protein